MNSTMYRTSCVIEHTVHNNMYRYECMYVSPSEAFVLPSEYKQDSINLTEEIKSQ